MRPSASIIRPVLLAAAAAALALAAACGGSSHAGKTTAPGGTSAPGKPASGGDALIITERDGAAPTDAAAAPGGAAPDSGALPLPSTLDQKIIMVSTLGLTVESVADAFQALGGIATSEGGFVASSSFGHKDDRETASVTIRVPSDRYEDALGRVRGLGDVRSEDTHTNDVTEQYTDLQSRLRSLQAALQRYMQLLDRAGDIGQVLQVQDRINQTQQEIERVQGRINLLDNQTQLATITVGLEPPVAGAEPKGRGPLDVAVEAFEASLAVLTGIATVALALVAFSWWLVPLGAAGGYVLQRQLRAARARQEAPPAPPAA